jgi:hypothetical protein
MIQTYIKQPVTPTRTIVSTLITTEGLTEIYKCIHSGKVITREKIDRITKVFHPGIIIGEDQFGRVWVAHNHISNKRPTFDLCDIFLEGNELIWDTRQVDYSTDEVVQRAIAEVHLGKTYGLVNYNCQTFVNLIVRDEHNSEAVDNLSEKAMIVGGLATILGFIFENKALVVGGLGVAGAGAVAKGYSRTRL